MTTLNRRQLLTGLIGLPSLAVVVAACGSDKVRASEPQDTAAPSAPSAPTTSGPSEPGSGTKLPEIGNQARLRIDNGVGGFTTAEMAFGRMPTLLVMGDGTAFRPGAQVAIFPGPLLPSIERGTVAPEAMAELMQAADDAGLLTTPPDYVVGQPPVADVGSTIVRLATGPGETVVHEAYALGFDTESSPARANLSTFVAQALAVAFAGGEVYRPSQYAVWAQPVNPAEFGTDPAPTVVPWPVTAIDLAATSTCTVVEAADVAAVFDAATQLTFFSQGDVTYAIAVRPVLPDAPGC